MTYRITVDTGGTFTDVVVADGDGRLYVGKSPTTEIAFTGIAGGLSTVCEELGLSLEELLRRTSQFVYGTTRATNAILERRGVARTALLVSKGFRDTLVLREGGKVNGFDLTERYPNAYVPRHLTFEINERVDSEGGIVTALEEEDTRETLRALAERKVEAVAVCLLWSIANDTHEVAVGRLLEQVLPGVPYTLSHQLNPVVREYRRASAACIDASLKPLIGPHLAGVGADLRSAGLRGDLLIATSAGGVLHLDDVVKRPIEMVRSGPSMAPIAAKTYGALEDTGTENIIVCDMGGTSFDVSLIRAGDVTYTRETWIGPRFTGLLTGASSVDIRSVGSGGGSIAWLDQGGLLRVGPRSAGADPGPACYKRGGREPTVTDAAVVLGYIDPESFLGGRMALDADAARRVIGQIADELELTPEGAAAAILAVANEHMVTAVQDITVNEGVDPREAAVVAGGGASGLSIVPFLAELGSSVAIVPRTAGALSATGAQFSDVVAEFSRSEFAHTGHFPTDRVNAALADLGRQAETFSAELQLDADVQTDVEFFVDARYAHQVWDLEIPVPLRNFGGPQDIERLIQEFHAVHERVYAVTEPGANIECLTWRARLRAVIGQEVIDMLGQGSREGGMSHLASRHRSRLAFFDGQWVDTAVVRGDELQPNATVPGPAIIEEPTSTLVVPPRAAALVTDSGNYRLEVMA